MPVNDDFVIVPSTRNRAEVMPPDSSAENGKLESALADNMDSIIGLAKDIVDIQRMRVQSTAILAKMAEDRKTLLAEAEAYVQKKNADTGSVISKIDAVRLILRDFYLYNDPAKTSITGDQFAQIIHDILSAVEGQK